MVLNVVAIVTPAPGKESEVEEVIKELTANVEKYEKDVLKYKAYKTTNAEGATEYVFQEIYKDENTLKEHGVTDHFKAIVEKIEEGKLLAKPLNIMKLEALSGYDGR
ncbi:hypothetical protein EJ08DRAFT_199537 [Tothia fuscella]|uniref:ABM domain-containing protein n=1 Tax=Tothia fuscella TaxID=1048955 RepID=A0A9P4NS32_9PEZI|nr:hypothetical protein EJ08DRAFT_199537 [Tothia fuscella]